MTKKNSQINKILILILFGTILLILDVSDKSIDNAYHQINRNIEIDSIKYDIWNETWGDSLEQTYNDVAFDNEGNIIVVGHSRISGDDDIIIRKFNSTGHLIWNQTWGNPSAHDRAEAV